MQNDPKKEIRLERAPFFGANQFSNAAAVLMLTYDDNQKAMKAHCRLAFSAQPQRLCLLLLVGLLGMQHRCYSTKVGHWRKGCSGRSRSFLLQFFLQKMFARLTLQFPSTYICICNHVRSVFFFRRWVTWSWHNIQRWNGSCILFP